MTTKIYRNISEPIRKNQSWHDDWAGPDHGIIKCWESGRIRAVKEPELAEQCLRGELPPLGWKGGVSRRLKKLEKYGALKYLAEWQGLRGEDLDIDLSQERIITCSKTGMIVTFTPDQSKYANQQNDSDQEGENSHGRSVSGIREQSLFP